MPGKRNLAKERATHDAAAKLHAFHSLLTSELPALDRALVGRPTILAELHRLGLRRRNGQRLTWRIVNRWRVAEGCPILRGNACPSYRAAPVSTVHALTAWWLSTLHHGDLVRVAIAEPSPLPGTFSTTLAA